MIMVVILFLALIIRLHNLTLFPLNHDEVTWTLRSIYNWDKFIGIPVACFQGYIQPIFSYLVFFFQKILPSPEYVLRLPSVIISTATCILIYQLAKQMYGKYTAVISALLLCFLPWHVIQSKIGVSLILTPFFGCLIFYALLRSIKERSSSWFIFSWAWLAIGAFYTYQASLVFIPVFLIILLCLRAELRWLKIQTVILSLLLFFILVFPLVFLYFRGQLNQYFGKIYGMYYQDAPFAGNAIDFITKFFVNFKANFVKSFSGLFFTKAFILYGQAFNSPLLSSFISFPLVLFSFILSLYKNRIQDRILVVWLVIGYVFAIGGVRTCAARFYFTVIMPPLLIFIASFIGTMLSCISEKSSLKYKTRLFAGFMLLLALIGSEIWQLKDYYSSAPVHFEELRYNSYGCKEAAKFLAGLPDIKKSDFSADYWMEPLQVYLNYYQYHTVSFDDNKCGIKRRGYFIIWAPETHPLDYREGEFSGLYYYFKKRHPEAVAIKTIFYPNGSTAINIYKIE